MSYSEYSTDALEQEILAHCQERSRLDSEDIEVLEELDRRQIASADGCRSLAEWYSMKFDVGLDTARKTVRTMRRTERRPELRHALAEGTSFDRVEALSKIHDDIGLMEHLDIGGLRRESARRARISADDEHRTAKERFLVLQPSLDESWWKLWGGLDGPSGAIVEKVLTEKADQLPAFPDGTTGDVSWRKATALVEVCTSDDPPPAQVTIFVDAKEAVESKGQAGVVLESGPKVGAVALEAILCNTTTEVIAKTEDGRLMEYGRRRRTVPPALKRAIIHRDGGVCAADGCESRYRLEAHHTILWSEGGTTNPDDLLTLCWFHHRVVVHERGFELFRHKDHGRIRFRRPDRCN